MTNHGDSTQRFSNRVADYVRFRPSYPPELLAWLQNKFGVDASWRVADIAAGTGISTKMFLDAGHDVFAVEPNAAMRAAATREFGKIPHFHAVEGTAEKTQLPDAGIDLVSAAQAFHWFDREKVRIEWKRILKRDGLAAIYWNSRLLAGSPFLENYEQLLRDCGDNYISVAERFIDDDSMRRWFGAGFRGATSFRYEQSLDFDALRGRLMSSSYAPKPGDPRHDPMILRLRHLFDASQSNGKIQFVYDTQIYVGNL